MDLEQLEAVARAATPGPWIASDWNQDDGPNTTTVSATEPEGPLPPGQSSIWPGGIVHNRVAETADGENPLPDAAHIATFDPPTVLKLIAVAKAAKEAEPILSRLDTIRHLGPFPALDNLRAALAALSA